MAVQISGFSLQTLSDLVRRAEEAEIEDATITVEFSSPKGNLDDEFKHSWTLQDVDSMEELQEEIEETEDAAKRRLQGSWFETDSDNQSFQEIVETLTLEEPEEVEDFRTLKTAEDDLRKARDRTRETYDRVDLSRTLRIQNQLEGEENLKEYQEGLEQVNETLDFEENVNYGEEDSAFEEGRQRTAGDITWVNQDEQEVRTLIFPNRVIFQVGGPQGQQVEFDDKEQAKSYYESNRVA